MGKVLNHPANPRFQNLRSIQPRTTGTYYDCGCIAWYDDDNVLLKRVTCTADVCDFVPRMEKL